MKRRSLLQLLTIALVWSVPLCAQERDATVALPGLVRLELGAEYLRVSSRFGDAGMADPWGLDGTLGPGRLAPVRAAADAFDAFLLATGSAGGAGANGSTFSAGELDFDASIATRHLPIRIAAGILPRVEVGVTLPIVLTQRLVRRFDVTPGNVGPNPDPTGNGAKLGGLGTVGTALGSSTVLPVAGTPAGDLLQARAAAATGQSLTLPTAPFTREQLVATLDFDRAPYDAGAWEVGDLSIDAKVLLISSFPDLFPQPGNRRDHRLAIHGSYRLPIDLGGLTTTAKTPFKGYSGFSGGVVGDLFVGSRFWASAGGSAWKVTAREDENDPIPSETRPGNAITLDAPEDGIELWVMPRARLTREISFGASLHTSIGGGPAPVGSVESGGQTVTSAGFTLRYSSLPALIAGEQVRPLDVSLGYTKAILGTDGAQRVGRAFLQFRLIPRLWGAGRIVATEP